MISNLSTPELNNPKFDLLVGSIKVLSAEAVQRANSGHPGMPMGMADCAAVLWQHFLRFSPSDPMWFNRDRFILSAGHGSMLIYSLLHLYGIDLSMDDIKQFRQLHSKTPGHPEFGLTKGVDSTTGPLGQGFANGVGMAISQKALAARLDPSFDVLNHRVFGIVSDGDLMEGLSTEAASIAGHLKLSNLVYIYDDNHISIDGETEITFTEDIPKKFEALGWYTQKIDGHDRSEIYSAIDKALMQNEKPSIICARTHIGHGAPTKQDTASSHGAPLGQDEIDGLKKNLDWAEQETFCVPQDLKELCAQRIEENKTYVQDWSNKDADKIKQLQAFFESSSAETVYEVLSKDLPKMPDATRSISSKLQQTLLDVCPNMIAGSADLAGSTKAVFKEKSYFTATDFSGNNMHFGVREHAMGAIMNGMAYYGGWVPVGSTFLVFSDYMRGAIRVAALAKLQSFFVFTHDSIYVGEDGPTHQPVEHVPALRLIPNLQVIRPGTSEECAAAWHMAMNKKDGPTAICLTRQKLDAIEADHDLTREELTQGAYVFQENKDAQVTLLATGSELSLAVNTKRVLEKEGVPARVVSVPCMERFKALPKDKRHSIVAPNNTPVLIMEAAITDPWYRWIDAPTYSLDMNSFGESGPAADVAEHFGFTPEHACQRVKTILNH